MNAEHTELKIELSSGNAAFTENPQSEVRRILELIGAKIENLGEDGGKIMDINGNAVGFWELTIAIAPEIEG